MALKLFSPSSLIPFDHETEMKKGKGFYYKDEIFVHHSDLPPMQTAFYRFSRFQIFFIFSLFIGLIACFLVNWHSTLVILVAVMTSLYFADLLFNLYLIYRSFSTPTEIHISPSDLDDIPDTKWPTYTLLCPLYKEVAVLPQCIRAMENIDYPREKLQLILLLEQDDTETLAYINAHPLPSFFHIVIIPDAKPKTKPKALNFGLLYATGEYTVIYDAEDIPEPGQLKKAVLAFEQLDEKTVCVQAKLNFYNPHQNLLTRVFTAEYSLWFDLVLTGLQSIHAPIPLGGTSNHFRTEYLRKLKGWDAFNVTEDCDLGMRLVKEGYQTAMIDSETLEEANSSLPNWFSQRTRWIKGYMQTYFLHMRSPLDLLKDWRQPHLLTFQLVVGGKVLSMLINPLMWVTTLTYFVFRAKFGPFIESFFPTPVLYMGVTSLILGNFLYMYYYMIGCAKHGHDALVKYVVFVPFYWLAMSAAAWVTIGKFLFEPHYWAKTRHGLHLQQGNETSLQPTPSAITSLIPREMISQIS